MPSHRKGSESGSGTPEEINDDRSPQVVIRSRRNSEGRLNTPPPEELEKSATVGYVYMAIAGHHEECSQRQADARQLQWNKIVSIDQKVGKIFGGLKLAALIATVLIPAMVAIMIPLVKYAVRGVVAEEFDKKVPSKLMEKLEKMSKEEHASININSIPASTASYTPFSPSDWVVSPAEASTLTTKATPKKKKL